ncbi:MAG: 50S ribosomal protein L3 [Planctomycetota bacterium]|nr:50S ribosomal protein L3 [Planctomycetota bacterium]
MPAILGKKIGMTSVYDDKGRQVPVTVIEAGPCQVLQVKTVENDGYTALQLGFAEKPERLTTQPLLGHFKKAAATPKRFIQEYRLDDVSSYQPGQAVTVAVFEGVAMVDVIGVSKGRGFAGLMKRHRFCGQPASHGTERKHRSSGGIGEGAGIPGRGIRLGKRMAGHMGNVRRTSECMKLIKIDAEANLLVVRGSIPGPNGGFVMVRNALKGKVGPAQA